MDESIARQSRPETGDFVLPDDVVADLELVGDGGFDRDFGDAFEQLGVEEFDFVTVFETDPNARGQRRIRAELVLGGGRVGRAGHAQHRTMEKEMDSMNE